jgi:hypothetical protein
VLCKRAVKNIGAAAWRTDNEYWTVYLVGHLAVLDYRFDWFSAALWHFYQTFASVDNPLHKPPALPVRIEEIQPFAGKNKPLILA